MDYISKPQVISKVIFAKFLDEGIDMKSYEVEQVINDFIDNSNILIELMANADAENIANYINDF